MTLEQDVSKAEPNQQVSTDRQVKKRPRLALLILCLFVGVGALFGGTMAFMIPDFMGAPLIVPMLQEIPLVGSQITSLAIPGAALLLFVFVPHTVAAILLLKKTPRQYAGALVCGIFLIAFTAGEMLFIPNPASVLYLLFGIAEIVLAFICSKS